MDMIESRLLAAIRQEAPPPADHGFKLAVMARIERQTMRRAMMMNVALTLAALMLLIALAPMLESAFATARMDDLAMAVVAAAITALLASFRAIRD